MSKNKGEITMQNKETGRQGNLFGRNIAKQYAEKSGLILKSNSNECLYNGEKSIIKSASENNSTVGICLTSLERVVNIILLKEISDNIFNVYLCEIKECINDGRATASKGKAKNFSVNKIMKNGNQIDTFIFDEKGDF